MMQYMEEQPMTALPCTDWAAEECPEHGRCTCQRDDRGDLLPDIIFGTCALHGFGSDHALEECGVRTAAPHRVR